MGCYDEIILQCPECGTDYQTQSKGGACLLRVYRYPAVPADVMSDVNRHAPFECESCHHRWEFLPPTSGEECVTVNGQQLSEAEVMTIRVALAAIKRYVERQLPDGSKVRQDIEDMALGWQPAVPADGGKRKLNKLQYP